MTPRSGPEAPSQEPASKDQPSSQDRLDPEGRLVEADLAEAAAHEINNIFNAIVLQLEVLKRKDLNDEGRSRAEAVQQKCRQAAALLKKLHHFGKTRSAALVVPLDVNRLVRELVGQYSVNAPGPGAASIVHELEENLPSVPAIPSDLIRLITLLLEHSLSVTPPSASITVRTVRFQNGCCLIVEDQGPGVAPEKLGKIFEPFTIARPGGNEWTLPVCKVLARRLNGSLRAENRPGGGMVITVELDPIH